MHHPSAMAELEVIPKRRLTTLSWVAIVLAVIGALNWGLVGLFEFNLVGALFGDLSPLSRIIYILVAISGIYLLFAATRFRETRVGGPTASA